MNPGADRPPSPSSRRAQASLEHLGTYGWVLLIIVIAGAAIHGMGFFTPLTYTGTSCVGFDKLEYRDHALRATREPGIWNIPGDDTGGDDRESTLRLRLRNLNTGVVRIDAVDVEYPQGTHVAWSARGYDCGFHNVAGDDASGCRSQYVTESSEFVITLEDVGRGAVDLRAGEDYRLVARVTYELLGSMGGHGESAICTGKVEGG